MGIDYARFYEQLQSEVRVSTDFAASMVVLMDWGAQHLPHSDWARLAAFDAEKELQLAREWLPKVLKKTPCPFPIRSAYFGLGEFEDRDGVEFADLYFGLTSVYDPADSELKWLYSEPRHYPDEAYLKSKALRQGGLLCNRESVSPSLGTPGHICFSVGFAALLLRHLLDGNVFRLFAGTAPIGVVTGFDSGDLLRLGEITANEFVPNQNRMV
jgi:hypothetical protein